MITLHHYFAVSEVVFTKMYIHVSQAILLYSYLFLLSKDNTIDNHYYRLKERFDLLKTCQHVLIIQHIL